MKRFLFPVFIGFGLFLIIFSLITFLTPEIYSGCRINYSYLNPLGLKYVSNIFRFDGCGGEKIGSMKIHFLLTDLTIIYWLGLLSGFLFIKRKHL